MILYSRNDITRGAGIFDYLMSTQIETPRKTSMRSEDAIGIVAAAFASGLNSGEVENFIEGMHFAGADHEILKDTLYKYEGGDDRFHLWNFTAGSYDQLCWDLRFHSRPEWRLNDTTRGIIAL